MDNHDHDPPIVRALVRPVCVASLLRHLPWSDLHALLDCSRFTRNLLSNPTIGDLILARFVPGFVPTQRRSEHPLSLSVYDLHLFSQFSFHDLASLSLMDSFDPSPVTKVLASPLPHACPPLLLPPPHRPLPRPSRRLRPRPHPRCPSLAVPRPLLSHHLHPPRAPRPRETLLLHPPPLLPRSPFILSSVVTGRLPFRAYQKKWPQSLPPVLPFLSPSSPERTPRSPILGLFLASLS